VYRIAAGRFEDTNRLFVPPEAFDVRVTAEGTAPHWAERILAHLRPTFDPQRSAALLAGRAIQRPGRTSRTDRRQHTRPGGGS
jgi:hypothetical protein